MQLGDIMIYAKSQSLAQIGKLYGQQENGSPDMIKIQEDMASEINSLNPNISLF